MGDAEGSGQRAAEGMDAQRRTFEDASTLRGSEAEDENAHFEAAMSSSGLLGSSSGGGGGPQRNLVKTASSPSASQLDVPEIGEGLVRVGSEMLAKTSGGGGGGQSPRAGLADTGEHLFDCDPRAWILAAGKLEKKRDGNWKAGWAKRFFVLTSYTLYYYLLPRRGAKGENNSLLGDERGQIRVSDIQNVRLSESSDGSLLHLECRDIRKRGLTQSSNTSIVLRAPGPEQARFWMETLKQARDASKAGAGRWPDGVGPPPPGTTFTSGSFASTLAMADEAAAANEDEEDSAAAQFRETKLREVLALLEASANVVQADGGRAPHLDPYLALACLVGINMCCYMGPALNEVSVWMLVNLAFLSIVVYYEKLANEHDATVLRYNRATKALLHNVDRAIFYAREGIKGLGAAGGVPVPGSPVSAAPSERASDAPGSPPSPVSAGRASQASSQALLSPPRPAAPTKPMGGRTMARAEEEEGVRCSWSECPASTFRVRQMGYKSNREKAPSAESLYELVGMDLLRGDQKLEGICKHVSMPLPRECDDLEIIKRSGLPRIFMVNIVTPMKMPGPFAGEDPGVSVVFYWAIKPETARAAAEGTDRPEVNLLKRFVERQHTDDDLRRRFKGIGIAANFEDLGLSSRLEPLNGKPVILFKTAQIQRTDECMEVNALVHNFGMVARGIFYKFKEKAPEVKIRAGFLIQAETDSELPECILGCAKVHKLTFSEATHIRDLK